MIELPSGQVRDYLAAFGATAIYVASGLAGKPSIIIATRDIARNLARLRRRWSQMIDCTSVVWAADPSEAATVVARAYAVLCHGPVDHPRVVSADAHTIADVLAQAALDLGVMLTDHDTAMMRARLAVDRINATLAHAQERGQLKPFNRAYQHHRMTAAAHGRAVMPYPWAVNLLRKAIARQIATDGTVDLARKNLLAGIFDMSKEDDKPRQIKNKSQRRGLEPLDRMAVRGT